MRQYKIYGSFDDRWGFFEATFEGKSSHKSSTKKVFKGKGQGTLINASHQKLMVKVLGREPATQNDCAFEEAKASVIDKVADSFNEENLYSFPGGSEVAVILPHSAQVEVVTAWNAHKTRPIAAEEWVLVEPRLRGNFQVFVGKDGRCLADEGGVLATFAHYTYHYSRGMVLACNLQGVRQRDGFQLVSPTVHSASSSFGPLDKSVLGMQEFFRNHVCTQTCRNWMRPRFSLPQSQQTGALHTGSSIPRPNSGVAGLRSDLDMGSGGFGVDSTLYQDTPPPSSVAVLMQSTHSGDLDSIQPTLQPPPYSESYGGLTSPAETSFPDRHAHVDISERCEELPPRYQDLFPLFS